MKLGEAQYLGGVETDRTDILSEAAADVTCDKCGWKGKDIQLIRFTGELEATDAFYRYTYREGVGEVKFLCPKCRAPVERKIELYGRAID
jgi:predicted RNA-binding Zn-ribbon protein involved in translation (DUF1610 family)